MGVAASLVPLDGSRDRADIKNFSARGWQSGFCNTSYATIAGHSIAIPAVVGGALRKGDRVSLLGKWITGVMHTEGGDVVDPLKVLDEKVYDTRVAFEAQAKHAAEKAKVPDAQEVAQSVTGYVFDFGDMDFGLHTTKAMKIAVEERLKLAYLEIDIPPEVITHCMVHRAWRQGRAGDRFLPHMVNLFKLALAIVGKRAAAAGEGLYSVHAETFKSLCELKVPDLDMARFITNREKADEAHAATAQEKAEADAAAAAQAETEAQAEAAAGAPESSSGAPAASAPGSALNPGAQSAGSVPSQKPASGAGTAPGAGNAGASGADPWADSDPFGKTQRAAPAAAPTPMALPADAGAKKA